MYSKRVLKISSIEICYDCEEITINHRIKLRFKFRQVRNSSNKYNWPVRVYVYGCSDHPLPAYVQGKNTNHLPALPGGYHYVSTEIRNKKSKKQVREAIIECAEIALGTCEIRYGYKALEYTPEVTK